VDAAARGIAETHGGFPLRAATTRRNTNYYVFINGNQGSHRVEREARWADDWPILFSWRRCVQMAGTLRTEFLSGAAEIYFFMQMWLVLKNCLFYTEDKKTRRVAQMRKASASLAVRLVNSATSSASPLISCATASATDATR